CPEQGEESGYAPLDEDWGNQPGPAADQGSRRQRWIESAERPLAQPLVEGRPLGRDRSGEVLRQPLARTNVVDPGIVLEHHRDSGQLVQPGQQRGEAPPGQGQLTELAVQILRALVEFGAPVDDIAQDLLLDLVEGKAN